VRVRKDGIIILRARCTPLQGMLRRTTRRHCGNHRISTRGHDDSHTNYGFFPELWKQDVDLMLENIPGIPRSNKLRIIESLEADLNQVLCITFTRNISRLAKGHSGIISEHQYGRANKTCLAPVLNKLLTVQLLVQKRTEGIVFDNDVKGCYDRIISGIALASHCHVLNESDIFINQ
jgi:hypothetical protein